MATPNKSVSSHVPQTSQSVSARAGVSGTVHHLATSGPVRSTATPFANLQQGILAMSMQTAQKVTPVGHTTVKIGTPGVPLPTKAVASPGPSPRKKIKVEEVPPATGEIASTRKLIQDERLSQMVEIKENYFDHLTECFFLQKGGQLMDYYHWRKKPTPELVHFLKSGHLDSDDEDENPLIYLRERKMTDEIKSQMIGPASTPVATSTTLPESVVALSQQGPDVNRVPGGRHGMVFGHIHPPLPPLSLPMMMTILPTPAPALVQGRTVGLTTSTVTTSAMSQQLSGQLHRSVSDSRLLGLASPSTKMSASSQSIKKSPGSPGRQAAFDGTNIKGISTQEAIVERAKQEAQVMSRVAELRKEGLWSSRRLPKVQEPTRVKAHWDYLLEEMQWLAADFLQERKWKKTCSRKIAKMVQKHFLDLEQKELRAEKEEGMKLRRIAGQIAKMVKEFWSNIEKVVQYKQNSRLDEKRKKAMDLHLNFIVDQTEKYSTWLSEGLAQSSKGSSVGSLNTTPDHSVAGDDEFKPDDSESDDEETIDKDEQGIDESETKDEVAALQKESEMPLDELIENLPKEILEKPATLHTESSDDETSKKEDKEFAAEDESEEDVEDSIAEQEKHEKPTDVKQELDELQDEGEMSIDELRAKYAAAYDDNFEMPQDSGEESTDIDDSDDEESESEEELEEEEIEEEVEEEVDVEGDNDVGLEELVKSEEKTEKEDKAEPGKELTDIAAQAASLQPKGYTLQTAEVKTTVPFLLKHTLREYQHVGLDWLATMYEKRLNGILADEMGLGKTIQTIALLAHLACDKGIWGPHLIVVPTSVMLNWEMEFKKWAPGFKILTYYGSQKERKQKRTGWTKTNAFHVCITSYKLVIQDHQSFRRKKWKYLILDEAQNIKNFKSQRWQTLLNFNSMRRLLLTGTPLQNSLMELWSLMHFLMPHVFQSHKDFKEWFANPLTGMIEGSHEYNESLIRRLHKVLRPFLLRRLKDDVEKQMPKKYEHIVMCHLSKRQRFLYDEFMAQGKTKETLATGHFMSVINILMQLRKVCNHPSLFDPRPIVSPFQMEGIVYNTASMVHHVLQYNPLEDIDLHRYPGLAEMERDLPAFIAHRVRKLQTCKRLIEEIDIQPPPPPRPHRGKLKQSSIRCLSPAVQSGRASPAVHSRSVSPSPVIKPLSTTPVTSVPGTTQPPLQATVLPQISARGISSVTTSTPTSTNTSQPQPLPSSQPITVQIQHTDQGTRLVVPSGQLSQLPGFIQIVQTSTGQHLITTSTPTSSVVSTSTVVNGSPVVTMATSTVKTMVSSVVSQVKMSAGIQSSVTTTPSIHWPAVGPTHGQKPVMRVSPLTEPHKHVNGGGLVFTAATTSATTSVMSTSTKPVVTPLLVKHWQDEKCKLSKTEFFMESLYDKQKKKRREKLDFIARQNKLHCEVKPVYGQDLCEAIDIYKDPYSGKSYRNRDKLLWHGPGHIHCHCAKMCVNPHHPKHEWNQTKVLSDIIHSPEQYLSEMEDVLQRFVFATPPVQSPPLQMHVSHPPPTYRRDEVYRDFMLRTKLSPKADNYHKISTKMTVQFPELRLIQYDCGKLQTMDILLRRLKSGDHRVLIFTQMTRMLDILEAFLNYHGHRYLRLDGTTKVEQRQLLMDRFNADRRIFCFILSTRSGGIGVNLTGADTVIFYDSDWNPTMDAQAQDRCHRIGQTRDVHIYRLVSERTVEENILKKANQKRMLGDMAIEGGNFTTAFFKENTITELFSEPSGLESFVKEKEEEEKKKKEIKTVEKQERKTAAKKQDPTEKEALAQFEKALAKTEDETDAVAIDQVKAEQKAELAEFDENIPWDEREAEQKEGESHVEMELAMLDKELSSIERFAVQFTEQQMEPVNNEELLNAEEDIELVKKDWELNRLKALKEEEERRAELEEDEMLYTYSRDDAYQQVKKRNKLLAQEAKKAAEVKAASASSPSRKSGRLSLGAGDAEELPQKAWVYKTPKIILELNRKKNDPDGSENEKSSKKKARVKVKYDEYDASEDVDVETVSAADEFAVESKKVVKKKLLPKTDKPVVKRVKKPKGELLGTVSREQSVSMGACSTEATRLDSLPGYSTSGMPNVLGGHVSPGKVGREGIFEKLNSPIKAVQDRANIFEQFGLQSPLQGIGVPQSTMLQNPLSGSTVRLVNTPQGRQMVIVSSSQPALQQNSQNVVLVQGMQGFPQGLVVGNNVVSLQGTPINMAALTRTVNPVNIQGARLAGATQFVNPRIAARIVSPVGTRQQNQTFVQRLVPAAPMSMAMPTVTGLPVPQLSSIPNIPIQGGIANIQQINTAQQFRVQTPLIHNSGGQTNPIQHQSVTAQRKATGQTIANLIAAGKVSRPTPPQPKPQNLPNLSNIMKAQIPATTLSNLPAVTQVKVNPAVAKLVASHIQAAISHNNSQHSTAQTISATHAHSPAIINLGSTTTHSQSPTIVKLVSASNLRTSSPITVTSMATKGQTVKAQMAAPTLPHGESPVATINIKGLPPGVSIPASLVNSLVSGSIGGMSKSNLNMIKGMVPGAGQTTNKTFVRFSNTNVNANPSPAPSPDIKKSNTSAVANLSTPVNHVSVNSPQHPPKPIFTANNSPTLQAWSNPNLVIRTRRAAIQQQGRSPSSIPTPVDSPGVQLPTPAHKLVNNHTNNNGPSPSIQVISNIPQASPIPFTVKKLEQNIPVDVSESQSNGTIEVVEIT